MIKSTVVPFSFPMTIIGSEFIKKVIPLVNAATSCIEVIVFDWRLPVNEYANPVAELLSALQEATTRGVAVRVLVTNEAIGDLLRKRGFDVKKVYTQKLMHCKLMLIDKQIAVVGSHNYTTSAFTQNLEASIAVRFSTSDNDFATFFKNLWGV